MINSIFSRGSKNEKQENKNNIEKNSIELDLPLDVVKNLPLITQTGNEKLIIENYRGIIEYTEEIIRLNTRICVIKIWGRDLYLKEVTTEILIIKGTIFKVEYLT